MFSVVRDFTLGRLGGEVFGGLSEREYGRRVRGLRADLLRAQLGMQGGARSVVVIVAGVDGAGKGEVIRLVNEWLDGRHLSTFSFWDLSAEAFERPFFWRYWRALPGCGRVAVWFGGWYSDVLIGRVEGRVSDGGLAEWLGCIERQERVLVEGGVVLLKFWFHLSRGEQERRLRDLYENPHGHWRAMRDDWKHLRMYDRFEGAADEILGGTHDGLGRGWFFVPSFDGLERNLVFGSLLLQGLEEAGRGLVVGKLRVKGVGKGRGKVKVKGKGVERGGALGGVDLGRRLSRVDYEGALVAGQSRLHRLFWRAYEGGVATVLVFEGWDASGKGGAIRRVTGAIDPRLFRIVQVGAPSVEEGGYHYLWRFWRDLPRDGRIAIFDRSWYGRVLVERVEGFAGVGEWRRAYGEINEFEGELARHGVVLLKFWIHISREKQLARFRSREEVAYKRHKITEEDWRNRGRWDEYAEAVNDMVCLTDRRVAPWVLVAGNSKRFARVQILEAICERLEGVLGG